MKRKFLAVILPLVGCATLVGSGFSAWYFGTTMPAKGTVEGSSNVDVTGELESDTYLSIAFTESSEIKGSTSTQYHVVLDQGGVENTDVKAGIMFTSDTNATKTIGTQDLDFSFTVTYSNSNHELSDLQEIYDAGLAIKVDFSVEIADSVTDTGNLADYIEFNSELVATVDSTGASVGEGETSDLKPDTKNSNKIVSTYVVKDPKKRGITSASWTFTLDLDTDSEKLHNYLLKYKEKPAGKDTGSAQLAAMDAAAEGATIKFLAKASIVSIAEANGSVGA